MKAPLTKTQYGLYVECSQHAGESCYNIPYLYIFDGSLDAERLRKAIETAVANHPSLFTRIELNEDGEPEMVLDPNEKFSLEIENIGDLKLEIGNFVQPFDLLKDRLFRMRLLRDKAHYYLLQDIHHIISDGTSRQVLLADIETAYRGEKLTSEGMKELTNEGGSFEADKAWYAAHFDCSDTYSPLLNDLEGTDPQEGKQTRQMAIEPAAVEAFCKANGVYKSSFFTSVYAFLLAKYNNDTEVLFNTIYNGRNKANAHQIGMFVRTFPMYAKWDNETKTLDWLKAVQELTSGCREHGAYAYSDAIQDLGLQCATEFAWHGDLFAKDTFAGQPLEQQRLNNNTRECPVYVKAFSRDGHLFVEAEYSANSYSEALISAFLESYEAVAAGMLSQALLRDIELVTPSQIALLDRFNETDVDYDATQTVVSLFRAQAAKTPDNIAVVYQDTRLTYREVDERTDAIAAKVLEISKHRNIEISKEPVVSVLINRSEWMVLASLGVLKAGCAYQPLDPSYPAERLNFMMKDANAQLLIADEELLASPQPSPEGKGEGISYDGPILFTKDLAKLSTLPFREGTGVGPRPSDLFIMLYTSGSTGVPKGCQLEHRNLVAFIHWYHRYYDLQETDKVTAYASYGFDACMFDMYPALTKGATVYIIPEEMRLDLIAMNAYFEREGITNAFMTTQVAYQFATTIENHSLKHFTTGGEKLASLVPPKGYTLHNGYGPTETTILETCYPVKTKLNNIPIGKALDNTRLYIVDPQGHRLPIGAAGELWISGPQVSRGYLNRPEKTAEVYIANPFATEDKYARVYRTGDIVRYLPDGNISFVGRRDGQVKIRGFRIELKEVEAVIRDFPGIKDVTVQAFDEQGGGKFVAAYIVSDQQIDIEALNNFILDQKPPYMVPAVTMQIEKIPLNQNQKVNKKALPKPEVQLRDESLEFREAPLNVLEQELHDMIAKIVNTEDFGVTTILGYVGLTSISSIKLAVQVNKRFGITLNSKALVKGGSIQSIENEILKNLIAVSHQPSAVSPKESDSSKLNAESLGKAPLSYAQTGVYFECLKNPTSTIYNIPYLLSYPAGITAEQVAKAVKELVEAHPEMHIHFATEGDTIIQTLADRVPVEVPISEMTDAELATHKTEFVQPFNLSKAPLYRFEVVKTESGVHLLMDTHHLIFDGGSADLFIRQLSAALEGQTIEKESYTYLQFVADQQRAEESEEFAAAKAFFAEKLATFESASEIPADLPKTTEQGLIGEAVCVAPHDQVASFCRTHEITAAHLYLAAVSYVVSRYTNNHDVFLSTISSGRSNLKIADTIGMFVNMLAIGLKIDEGTVADYLKQVSSTFDTTLEHENYPFARINADFGFVPSIAYAYQVGVLSEYKVNGQAIGQELLELNVPKFPINIKIESRGVVVQYDDARYSARVAQGLADSIVAVAERMIAEPAAKLRKLSIISAAQEEELSHMREVATAEVPFHYYHECIPYYAKKTPDATALIACDATYTYKQFDALTNRIANALRARGVAPRSKVALLQPRTSKVFLSIFGVMKAGCAYIPCDPEYPTERIQHILNDSHAPFVITTADRLSDFPNAIDVDELLAEPNEAPVDAGITPQDLCYLIYTSGSTGKPKGVMLRHESIANYLYNHPANTHIHAIAETVHAVLCVTTLSFDMSMKEFGGALFNGKTAVIANEEETKNAAMLADLFKRTGADAINATPSRMLQYMELEDFVQAIGQCHVIMCGGEKYADGLLDKLRAAAPNARIFNTYGPTEITVSSNCKELTHTDRVSVGRPLLNYHEFVVDSDGNELPAGVVGELYIGGIGVASGYNELPDMTAERFINYKGYRIYKSGDYARWTEEGDVVILGRTDNQIKLRGLRIELGEVEAALAAVEGIKTAVVKIGKIKGIEHLCAYFTADRPIDIPALKAELGKTLTKYMVPTAYKQMDKMPITPNGKTDIKNLPEPELALSGDYEAPANETERIFCDIFANILQLDKVGATDNFFEMGGTSLVVTRVIIEADKAGKHVSYGEVFANPTPRQLAELLGESAKPIVNDEKVDHFDYTAINNLLQRNTLNVFRDGERQALGDVLVTGATGYLGIHILHDLIDSDAQNIFCLVRGKSVEAAESRLRTLLYYYFSNAYKDLFGKRLHIILGDVTQDFDEHLKVDTVFNCAAVVKHFSEGTEIEDVNIGGAQRCVEFCIKTGAKLIHVSTASTRGLWVGDIKDDVYTEQRLYMGQYLGNQYIYSKYMAERLILDAVALHGLSAKIMRVGNLAARSTDGEFQANFSTNSFMGRIKVYSMLGCCPYAMRNKSVEFSPINEVAHAIVLLATTPKDCTVFHPYNIHGQFLGDVLAGLTTIGQGIRFVEQEEFNAAIEIAGNDPQKAKQMSALLAYKDMAHGQKTADVKRDNDYTTQVLYRLGFSWSPTSWDYVERMLNAISGFGFFEV